jgi:hypothetical protein
MSAVTGRTSTEGATTRTLVGERAEPIPPDSDGGRPLGRDAGMPTVLLRAPDGAALTTARVRLDGARLIVLSEVREPDVLMAYYFLQGASLVTIMVNGRSAEGRLDTRWQHGSRTWMVRLPARLKRRAAQRESSAGSGSVPDSSGAVR